MAKRSRLLTSSALVAVLVALVLRATTTHSTNAQPLIYRATVAVNDLDSVEGIAPPGRLVELWARQRNFIEGEDGTGDPFSWCRWKNDGHPVFIDAAQTQLDGRWTLTDLRQRGTTVMIFPPGPGDDRCLGGVYTELLTRACDARDVNCTTWEVPTLHWLNVRRLTPTVGVVMGSVSNADQAAASVADGPNDGPDASDVVDVDENGVDTTRAGLTPGQRVTWRCGQGGTTGCPSITIHDASTALTPDLEYPFVVGTIQAHRPGGSVFAAAAIARGQPIGFAVNVNVRFRGQLDINLGCDRKSFFDFS